MSDPIADILTAIAMRLVDLHESEPATGYSYDPPTMIIDNAAKQIRQQIGRELLERSEYHSDGGRIVWIDDIHKICQLEGES